jgi:hypothetical protein
MKKNYEQILPQKLITESYQTASHITSYEVILNKAQLVSIYLWQYVLQGVESLNKHLL